MTLNEPVYRWPLVVVIGVVVVVVVLVGIPVLRPFIFDDKRDVDTIDERARHIGKHVLERNESTEKKLVCYINYVSEPAVRNVDPRLCTHLNVAFATVHYNTLKLNEGLKAALRDTGQLKKINPRLKVFLSVGGATAADGFPQMVSTHENRKTFIKSSIDALNEYRLDGLDVDWEFPFFDRRESVAENEQLKFAILLEEIRKEFDRHHNKLSLSVAVAAQESIATAAYNIPKMNEAVDFVNVMTYDFNFYTKQTPFTGFNSPLFPRKEDALPISTLNIKYSVEFWIREGMSKEKIIVGLPTFGHSFQLINANNDRPGSPANGYGKVGSYGFVSDTEILQYIETHPDSKYIFDNETCSPYVTFLNEWISFEDKKSLQSKVEYIKSMELGGVMIYSLNSDNYLANFTLTEHVNKILYNVY